MISKVLKFARLPLSDKFLFLRVALVVLLVRVCIFSFSYSFFRRLWSRKLKAVNVAGRPVPSEKLLRAIHAVSPYFVPTMRPCYTTAMAACYLMVRSSYAVRLIVGVKKDSGKELKSHAWLVYQDQVVVGWLRDLRDYRIILQEDY